MKSHFAVGNTRKVFGIFLIATLFSGLAFMARVAFAAAPFYEGKVIRIIVSTPPGGGFDLHARLFSRHLGKHIPGNPTFIVENMPGAGSLIATNYIYNMAKPDGLTIGHFNGTVLFNQILGQEGTNFDPQKFEFIGSPEKSTNLIVLSKASGITSVEKWLASKTPVKFGGVASGSVTTDTTPRMLKSVLGFPVQLVSGYKGTAEIRLAVDTGEVAGVCVGWDIMNGPWREAMQKGNVVIVMQAQQNPLPQVPNIPQAISFAKTEEARQLIKAGIYDILVISRPFALPPGTPKDRVQLLRNAFQATLKDKEFLTEVEKTKAGFDPVSGEEFSKIVAGLSQVSPSMVSKLKDILFK